LRLLIVVDRPLPPDSLGGRGWSVLDLASGLAAVGAEPTVICYANHRRPTNRVWRDDRFDFPLYRVDRTWIALNDFAALLDPAAIVLAGPPVAGLLDPALKTRRPVFAWLRNCRTAELDELALDPEIRFLATSGAVADHLLARFGRDSIFLPEPIPVERYAAPPTGSGVLYVDPSREKGFEIVANLAERLPSTPFAIAERRWLHKTWRGICADRLGEAETVEWLAPTLDIREHFARASVILAPHQDGCSAARIVREASLAGLLTVASDLPAIREQAPPDAILLPPTALPEQWEEATREMLASAEREPAARRAAAAATRQTSVSPIDVARWLLAILWDRLPLPDTGL
jgi:glycosyltransferase involved in cell wall biosynthesis